MQVTALGPVPVKGLAEPVEVFELVGASTLRRRFQAAVARGLTRFVGRQTELEALQQALARAGTGHGQIVAMVGEAGVGKSRLVYEFVHSPPLPRAGGCSKVPRCPMARPRRTFPVIDLLKRYVHVEERDDSRTIRAKVTGQVLTLDETLQEIIPALLSLLDALPDDSPFLTARARRSAASAPSTALKRCCCARARCNRCCWSLRICTGSIPRRRPCSTAWSRACPRPGCCSWSTTARVPARLGQQDLLHATAARSAAARPVPTNSCRPCSGTTPAWHRSNSC